VGASTAKTPAIAVAVTWFRSGKSVNTEVKTAGINIPPQKPCTIRNEISAANPLLKPHEPYTREAYEEAFTWIAAHNLFAEGEMGSGRYEDAILSTPA